jgi:hypothetical protein
MSDVPPPPPAGQTPQPGDLPTSLPAETPAAAAVAPAPPAGNPKPRPGRVLAIVAFVLAIVGFLFAVIPPIAFLTFLFAITAVVLGIVSLARRSLGKPFAIVAVIVGGLAWLISIPVALSGVALQKGIEAGKEGAAPSSVSAPPAASSTPKTPATKAPATKAPATQAPPAAPDLSAYAPISDHDFALIVKDPDASKGKKVVVFGVVTQFDAASGPCDFLADTAATQQSDSFSYTQNTWVHASKAQCAQLADVVQGDHLQITADVLGSKSYDTQAGGNTTVPELGVEKVDVLPALAD